jgi:hypothetical protein
VLPEKPGFWHKLLRRLNPEFEEQPAPAYVVEAGAAVDALRKINPSAAQWWSTHAPHMLRAGKRFLFAPSCCVEISGPQA